MATLNFPSNPTIGDIYAYEPYRYTWDGEKWKTIGIGYNPAAKLSPTVRSDIQRLASEAGYNLVSGSFEDGGSLTATVDVLWSQLEGKYYSWGGTLPKVVAAGSSPSPVSAGAWVDRTDLTLRGEISAIDGAGLIGSMSYAQLRAYSGPQTAVNVWGIRNAFDGAAGQFRVNASDTTSADNGGTILVDAIGRRWYRVFSGVVSVKWFGVVGDGSTDDYSALHKALNSGYSAIYCPPEFNMYSSQGVVIPTGVTLWSVGFLSSSSGGAVGAKITTANSVNVSVTLQGNAGLKSAGLKGFIVTRTGTPPAGSVGVLVSNGYNPVLEDVLSVNHAIPLKLDGSNGGISCSPLRVYTASATDTHVLIYNWPEFRASQCRFGSNGLIDVACNAYVRLSGTGAGPNTVMFDSCQFNQGQSGANTVTTLLDFSNMTGGGQGALVGQYSLSNCHTEGHLHTVTTDSTVTILDRLTFVNTEFTDNVATGEFWNLNAATAINYFKMIGCDLTTHAFTLTPTAQFNQMILGDNTYLGAVSITGVSNSTLEALGCFYAGGLTLAGSFYSANLSGEILGGSLTTTGITSGRVQLNFPGTYDWIAASAPVLSFGGAATGITYSTQKAQYRFIGSMCVYEFVITLTSKGTATGVAKIAGLPVNATNSIGPQGGSCLPYILGMASIGGPVSASPSSGTQNINLYQVGSTGIGALSDTNFTNSTTISGTLMFAT